MTSELDRRIRTFFGYWRIRLDFARALDFDENWHEANVLLWAALDALGNLWARSVGRTRVVDRRNLRSCFDVFLATYGGEPFQRVALPDVWHRAAQPTCGLPSAVKEFVQGVDRVPSTPLNCHMRATSDDPELAALFDRIDAACVIDDPASIREWLALSRYGSIAYKRMRSSFLHEGRPGEDTHSFALYASENSPTYLSMTNDVPAVLGFSPTCMATVLNRCIDGFERDALASRQDPVPPRRRSS